MCGRGMTKAMHHNVEVVKAEAEASLLWSPWPDAAAAFRVKRRTPALDIYTLEQIISFIIDLNTC